MSNRHGSQERLLRTQEERNRERAAALAALSPLERFQNDIREEGHLRAKVSPQDALAALVSFEQDHHVPVGYSREAMSVIQRNRALLQQHAILSASPSKPPAPNVTVVPPTPPATPPSNLVPLTAEKTQTAETLQQQFISDRAARLKELSQEPLSAHIETITEKTSKILEALGIAYDATASIGDVLEALELRQAENQTAQEAQIRTLQTERAELRQQLEAALKALRCKEGNGKPTASSSQ